jgi:hypothetical protein
MTKTMVWAGLALSALLALSGCHKIRKCTIGEDGCLESPPDAEGNCAAGLELRGGVCVEPSGGGDDVCGGCLGDEVCDEDSETCISYCEYDDELPAREPTPQGCEAPNAVGATPYTYADVCISLCEQRCLRAQEYCTGFTCNLDECSQAGPERRIPTPAALARCTTACPAPPNLACITAVCEDWRDTACQEFECPAGTTRDCANIRCTDTCASDNIQDGFCDDGDPASADYSFCQYGTDCGDCGPRRGTRPARAARGELCPPGQDVACDGYNDDYLKTNAWCLRIYEDNSAPSRCVPDCTTATGEGACPGPDYLCLPAVTRDGEAITDVHGTEGYYCQPLVCE